MEDCEAVRRSAAPRNYFQFQKRRDGAARAQKSEPSLEGLLSELEPWGRCCLVQLKPWKAQG